MMTSIVQFQLSASITLAEAQRLFYGTAPNYRAVKGLIRKYYLLSEDGKTAGGVYLWETRADADRLYTEEWKRLIKEKYGSSPSITFFESPVIVDNLSAEILSAT